MKTPSPSCSRFQKTVFLLWRGSSNMEEEIEHDDSKPKVSISAELLKLETNATALEKRLLVWNRGDKVADAKDLLKAPPSIGPVPESSVLGRIKSFLPTLDEANRKLFSDIKTNGAEQFNIESVTNADERYVEMDLALGVADLHTPEAVAAAELASNGQVIHMGKMSNCFDSSSGSDSDDEESHGESDMQTVLELMRTHERAEEQPAEVQNGSEGKGDLKRKKIEQL
ncbi:hypothetical protein R1flu_001676 [Riccia fluitans]|uniref:Uncharacterized protein n=1 Tax=Riccia fluitans TaxID=41844 RepID=A0ABD1Y3Y4_9MARC